MDPTYKLYYWPGLPGRGEYIRLILECIGVPYEDVAKDSDAFQKVMEARKSMPGTVHYAPPILEISDTFSLSHTAVIAAYLAKQHGLMPEGEKEWIAIQIDHMVHDIMGECHNTHHPVDAKAPYEEQKTEAKRCAEVYTKQRLPALLPHLEKCVMTHGGESGPYLFGKDISYVDLSIAQLLRGLEHAFPRALNNLAPTLPRILALREAVDNHERIAAYRKSDRCVPFADGIFRSYPELDS